MEPFIGFPVNYNHPSPHFLKVFIPEGSGGGKYHPGVCVFLRSTTQPKSGQTNELDSSFAQGVGVCEPKKNKVILITANKSSPGASVINGFRPPLFGIWCP